MNGNTLIRSLSEEFRRGVRLIEGLSDTAFSAKNGESGSVGAHIRHNFDFASNSLAGISGGLIDYSDRERDERIETERVYAKKCFESIIGELNKLGSIDLNTPVKVRSEVDEKIWLESSVGRELEFLLSHTIHHYALISAKLKSRGIESGSGFGVAPSTIKYWNLTKNKASVA